jgi:hypothetical protein
MHTIQVVSTDHIFIILKDNIMKKPILYITLSILYFGCDDGAFFPGIDLSGISGYNYYVMVCHKNEDGSFVPLEVNQKELAAHLAHGDYRLDVDKDGYTAFGACSGSQDDCDDHDRRVYPGADELCVDAIDNNCDGRINEGCLACEPPKLEMPEDQATMDNGCKNQINPLEWKFQWEDCLDATQYHLYVKSENALNPLIDIRIMEAQYDTIMEGYYVADIHLLDWKWKVRSFVDDTWTQWSESWVFEVEPLNTDCP